jgi:NAD(P)-dependent dehydrogenase (short-subunit alcohol dehydrogenase family)
MDLEIKGRVAIVTGGSRSIGRACAESLLREGATVVLVSRDAKRLENTRRELTEKFGVTVAAVPTELRSDDSVREMVEHVLAEFGRIEILVNCAATVTPGTFLDLTEDKWMDVFEQKLNGYARCLRHVIPAMQERQWGRIINLSGLSARQPHVTTVPVGLNNSTVLNITKSLATELAKDGIRVNAVIPHIIDTDRQDETMQEWAKITDQTEAEVRAERVSKIPIGRMGRAEDVADVVAFLASERTNFVTGAAWHVDGGISVGI